MTEPEEPKTNRQICRMHCPDCTTFKENNLKFAATHDLYCVHGKSEVAEYSIEKGCNCLGCELFSREGLKGGWFCLYGLAGKK
ncbi:MAG TPA: DUF2769 domain-containing protein [Methanoregulaceae archaeon]|nr:DUF2769 domain-containing protein [Methanoregulaceae archaeon]